MHHVPRSAGFSSLSLMTWMGNESGSMSTWRNSVGGKWPTNQTDGSSARTAGVRSERSTGRKCVLPFSGLRVELRTVLLLELSTKHHYNHQKQQLQHRQYRHSLIIVYHCLYGVRCVLCCVFVYIVWCVLSVVCRGLRGVCGVGMCCGCVCATVQFPCIACRVSRGLCCVVCARRCVGLCYCVCRVLGVAR